MGSTKERKSLTVLDPKLGGEKKTGFKIEEMGEAVDDYLKSLYYDMSKLSSYTGLKKFWLTIKKTKDRPKYITKKSVEKWLENQEVYRQHQPHPENLRRSL